MISRLGIVLLALLAAAALTFSENLNNLTDKRDAPIQDSLKVDLSAEPQLSWQVHVNGMSGPSAVSRESIFVAQTSETDNGKGGVYAYDRKTGVLQWSTVDHTSQLSPVIHSGESVYFAATRTSDPNAEWPFGRVRIYQLDAATGAIEWTQDVTGDLIFSLRMTDHSTIELTSRDKKYKSRPNGDSFDYYQTILEQTSITSFDAKGGRLIRRISLEDTVIHSNIAYTDDEFFAISSGQFSEGELLSDQSRALRVFDLTDGALIREIEAVQVALDSNYLAVDSSTLYMSTNSVVSAIDSSSGEIKWTHEMDNSSDNTQPIYVHNNLLVYTAQGIATGLDASNGELLWKHVPPNKREVGFPTIDNNVVYLGEQPESTMMGAAPPEGALVAINGTTGAELWRHETEDGLYGPQYIDDELIVVTVNSNIGHYGKTLRVLDRTSR